MGRETWSTWRLVVHSGASVWFFNFGAVAGGLLNAAGTMKIVGAYEGQISRSCLHHSFSLLPFLKTEILVCRHASDRGAFLKSS